MARRTRRRVPITGISVEDVRKKTKRGTVHYTMQRDKVSGRFIRGLLTPTGKETTKTFPVPNRGENAGLISFAMGASNITRSMNKKTRRVEVTIKGRDKSEKAHRIRYVMNMEPKNGLKAQQLGLFTIIQALRRHGFRTQYNIDRVSFSDTKWTKAKARRMKPLHDVEMTVRVIQQ